VFVQVELSVAEKLCRVSMLQPRKQLSISFLSASAKVLQSRIYCLKGPKTYMWRAKLNRLEHLQI